MKDYFKKLKYLFSWKDMIFTVVLFTLFLSFAFMRADKLVEITFGETSVDIVSARYSMNIPYDMVERIELAERIEDSQLLEGKGEIALQTGRWTNDTWGEHYVCLDMDADNCILVYLNDGRLFVFNRDDEETTAADFEIFRQYLQQD